MTTPDAQRIADKYIGRDGGEPVKEPEPARTAAGAAWRDHAAAAHRILRRKSIAGTEDGRLALWAFERIGDAIAIDEKKARGRR
jgi:hypothetical protein